MSKEGNNLNILDPLAKALLANLVVSALFLSWGWIFGGPNIYIEKNIALFVSLALTIIFAAIIFWSAFILTKYDFKQNLIKTGPYRYVRYPIYSAIIFLLNPALAIYLRSWLLFLAIIPIYFIWKKLIKNEEKYLEEKFGQEYYRYQNLTWAFIPKPWKLNKGLFFPIIGLLIFSSAYILLNFSAIYLRWVSYEYQQPKKQVSIAYDNPRQQPPPSYFQQMFAAGTFRLPDSANAESYEPNYTKKPNTIIISKINVDAPLVMAQATTQKELNQALDQGVIIYPGSALPGQDGEVFLSGHSSVYPWDKTRYGQIFTLLDKLETGDIVSLVYENHQFDYRITGKQILAPKETKLILTNKPTITLMTCWPIGTSFERLVVRGELIQ